MKVVNCENCGNSVHVAKICPHCNHVHSEEWIKKATWIEKWLNVCWLVVLLWALLLLWPIIMA